MMSREKRKGLIVGLLLLVLTLIGGSGWILRTEAAAAAEPFVIETEVGYGGDYIAFRRAPVQIRVTSQTEDFLGRVEFLYGDNTGDVIRYSRELVLAAGETKDVTWYIKLPMEQTHMTTRVVDRDGKVLQAVSQDVFGNIESGRGIMGVLSNIDIENYRTDAMVGLVKLEASDIVAAEDMEMLDVILVDQFDLDSLSADQIGELEDWVRQGGTLVLGTGSYYNQTLSSLSGEFLSGKVGDLQEISYGSEYGGVDLLSYCPLELADAESVMELEGKTLLWKVERGEGSVLVSAIGLEMPVWVKLTLGMDIQNEILHHISAERKQRIEEEYYGNSVHYVQSALNQGNAANMPNIPVYVVVLCIYVVCVGPVLYLVLRHLDRRHYLWVLVPALSLVFAGVVFLLGSATRIREPYMSYVTYLDYGEEGIQEDTYFAVTAPYNKTYNLVLSDEYRLSMIRNYGYMSYTQGMLFTDYDIGISQKDGGQDIELKDPAAFESFQFIAENTLERKGDYEVQLQMSEDGSIAGTITNDLGYDLQKLCLVHQGAIYLVGDVADGQTVEFDSTTVESAQFNRSYGINHTDFMERIFNYNYYRNGEETRRYNALSYYLNSSGNLQAEDSYLLGLSDAGTLPTLSINCEMPNYGVQVAVLPVEGLGNSGFVYSIDEYLYDTVEGSWDMGWNRYMESEVVVCEYAFTQAEEPHTIWYTARFNNELQGRGYDYFPGKISFYNHQAEDYDVIFDGVEGTCTDLDPYLQDGHLTIRYEVEQDRFYNERYNIVVPTLSMSREVKTDGTN